MIAEALAPEKRAQEPPKPLGIVHILGPMIFLVFALVLLTGLFLLELFVGGKCFGNME